MIACIIAPTAVAAPRPIAAYSFDEGSGTTATDSARNHDGTITGATWVSSGKYGSALDFDGTDDLVSVANAADLDLTSSFTLEAWVRPDALAGYDPVVGKLADPGSGFSGYLLATNSSSKPAGVVAASGSLTTVAGTATLPVGAWSHLAFTSDGTSLRLYLDGVLVNTKPALSATASGGDLKIGFTGAFGTYFDGLIDEVRIYDEALDQDQVEADKDTAVGLDQIPVAAYSFDEGSGTTLHDSARNHDGTIEGAAWTTGGKYGGALEFDGIDDLVSIADTADLDLTGSFTLEAWVKPDSLFEWSTALAKAENPGGKPAGYWLSANAYTGPSGNIADGSGEVRGVYDVGNAFPTGAWSHLAVTYDGTILRIYVNGQHKDSSTPPIGVAATATSLKIGNNPIVNTYFDGLIDEVRLYDEALSAGQIFDTTITSGPAGTSTSTSASLTFEGRASTASFECSLDGASFSVCTSAKSYAGLSDGSHVFRVRAINGGSMKDQTPAERRFQVDTVAPETTIDSGTPANVEGPPPSVEFSSNESGATFACSLDGAPSGSCESPFQLPWMIEGPHVLTVKATDAAGNVDASPVTWAFEFGWNKPIPVAAYSFDEGSGTTLHDSARNHDGTIEGAAWTTGGKYGGALEFDGIDDLVSVANAAELDLTNSFSLEAWVRPDTLAGYDPVVGKLADPGSGFSGYLLATNSSSKPAGVVAASGSLTTVAGTATLPTGAWSHLAFTSDGTNLRLYLDGVLVNTKPALSATASGGDLKIGFTGAFGTYFDGRIDEVRIYDEALNADEILESSGIVWSATADSDIDGDGHADLITIDSEGTAHVFSGTESGIAVAAGASTLVSSVNPALYDGKGQYMVDVSDVTGEGRADLVTLRSDGHTYTHPGRPDGTFDLLIAGPTLGPVMNEVGDYEPIAVADVTGDGHGDLVGVDHTDSDIITFPGQSDGTFSSAVTGEVTFDSALLDDVGNYALDVSDVTGEGRADLVTIYTDGKSEKPEEVLVVYPGQATGEFGSPVKSQTLDPIMDDRSGEEPVGVGDVDGDGRADLVSLNGTSLKFRAGKADGTFAEAASAYSSAIDSNLLDGTGEELIGLLDYTGDGRTDLVSSQDDGDILTYNAQSSATFAAPTTHPGPISSSRFDMGGHEFAYEKPFLRRAVDPNAPKVTTAGPLIESADGPLGVQTAKVNVSASDGTGTGSSGVTKIQMLVDGEQGPSYNVPCSPTCEEPATTSFMFSKETWGAGPHDVEIQAIDAVGKKATTSIAVDVPDGPSIVLDGPLYQRRGRTVGSAVHQLSITTSQTDGNSEAPRPGVKTIEVRVDGKAEGSSPEQACPAGNCAMERTWNFNPTVYTSGAHMVLVLAKDQQGNTTQKQFEVTVNPSDSCADSAVIPSESCPPVIYDVVHAWQYTGNPANGGSLVAEEWVQLGTHNARRVDPVGIVTTRGIVPCEVSEQGCGEVRQAPTGIEGTGNKYVITTGVSSDDPNLNHVVALRQPTTEKLGEPVSSGPIGDALKGWQDAPPNHGSTYDLYETETFEENVAVFHRRWWLDTETELPLRYSVIIDNAPMGGEVGVSHYYFTYDQVLKQATGLPGDFFLLNEPKPVETIIEETAEEGVTPGLK